MHKIEVWSHHHLAFFAERTSGFSSIHRSVVHPPPPTPSHFTVHPRPLPTPLSAIHSPPSASPVELSIRDLAQSPNRGPVDLAIPLAEAPDLIARFLKMSAYATSLYPSGTPAFRPMSPVFEDKTHPASLSACGIHSPALLELIRTDVSTEMVCEYPNEALLAKRQAIV